MSTQLQNLTQTFRRLRKSPTVAIAVILSLALGIAANATIFSMVSTFLLRPAPVGDPATLLTIETTTRGDCCNNFAYPLYADLHDQATSFSGVAAYHDLMPASISASGNASQPERVWGQPATTNYFDVAQTRMTLGRGFTQDEAHAPVIVLGHQLWLRRFAADPAIVGKSISLSGRPFTVVGIAPPTFRGLDLVLDIQFWVPLANIDLLLPQTSNYTSRDYHWLVTIARLKPSVTLTQATAELNLLAQRFAQAHPESDKDGGFRFEQAGSLPPKLKTTIAMFLLALSIVVLLVLGIACANVTNLLLAQASSRQKEMAVRVALGASRTQLLTQMLSESVILALAGGLCGLALSLWATKALDTFRLPVPVPLALGVSVDWRVLLYSFLLSIAAGLIFGLAPAWAASRTVLSTGLKGQELLARPGSRWTLRNLLVVAQVAMAMVLLCATGLFLRSLQSASSIDIGFRPQGLLMLSVDPQVHGYSTQKSLQFLARLRERVAALPGVTAVASTDVVPLSMGHRSDGFAIEGEPASAPTIPTVDMFMVSPGYFATMGIPLIAGQDFRSQALSAPALDCGGTTPPSLPQPCPCAAQSESSRASGKAQVKDAVVNQAFAQTLFPQQDPINRQVSGGGVTYRIIGVAKNTKSRTLGESQSAVLYRSLDQTAGTESSMMGYALVVRTPAEPSALARSVREQVSALDPNMAVFNTETMQQHLHDALFLPRFAGTMFAIFGSVGLILAAVGLFGVMSYSVSRRTREIGIRMAVGAAPSSVQSLIVRQGLHLTAIGGAVGLAAALAVSKFAASLLYGVHPRDAATFSAVPAFLAAVALLATWLPARRAARVDPLTALRHD
jgi:predicted permease